MEEKHNNSTELRPEGDRVLDAVLVKVDLEEKLEQIRKETAWKEGDRNAITVFKNEIVSMVLISLHAGAELKPHKAPGLINVQVLDGEISFSADNQVFEMKKGQLITLRKDIPHSIVALEESAFLLTLFSEPN